MKIFRWLAKPKKEKHMDHFSQENLEKLVAEHRLVAASIAHMEKTEYPRFARTHGHDTVNGAISQLRIKKVQLEGMIDVLTAYLN